MTEHAVSQAEVIGREAFDLLGTARQVAPFTARWPGFDLDAAYAVAARLRALREARGERAVGRKIGFTNRAVWGDFGIAAPIWSYVYDRTVRGPSASHPAFDLALTPEPRIEPELVLHLARAPAQGMSAEELAQCVDWVAAGFEVVYSIFPGWSFAAADAVAAYGVHGALVLGPTLALAGAARARLDALSNFDVALESDRGARFDGHARDVLGGPLLALRFLVEEIGRRPGGAPLEAGEIVTTGTLTEAPAAIPGESWTARFRGLDLAPLRLSFG